MWASIGQSGESVSQNKKESKKGSMKGTMFAQHLYGFNAQHLQINKWIDQSRSQAVPEGRTYLLLVPPS